MGKWTKIRIGLRIFAIGAGIVASMTPPGIAAILAALATGAGTLSFDLPRDRWTDEQKRQWREQREKEAKKDGPKTPID